MPQAVVVSGFEPIMPTFQGLLREREILGVIEFIEDVSSSREQEEIELWRTQLQPSRPPRATILIDPTGPEELADHRRPQAHRPDVHVVGHSFFMIVGGLFALLVRLELLTPKTDAS